MASQVEHILATAQQHDARVRLVSVSEYSDTQTVVLEPSLDMGVETIREGLQAVFPFHNTNVHLDLLSGNATLAVYTLSRAAERRAATSALAKTPIFIVWHFLSTALLACSVIVSIADKVM